MIMVDFAAFSFINPIQFEHFRRIPRRNHTHFSGKLKRGILCFPRHPGRHPNHYSIFCSFFCIFRTNVLSPHTREIREIDISFGKFNNIFLILVVFSYSNKFHFFPDMEQKKIEYHSPNINNLSIH